MAALSNEQTRHQAFTDLSMVLKESRLNEPSRSVRVALVLGTLFVPPVCLSILGAFPSRDLHSHLYTAWLARRVSAGELPGLGLAPIWTNALFDHIASVLMGIGSPHYGEVLAIILLTQGFIWSSFFLVRSAAGLASWEWLPILNMLAFGWTLHMGFANFLLSLALSMFAVALILGNSGRYYSVAGAVTAFGLAVFSNPIPVAWATTVLIGSRLFKGLGGRRLVFTMVLYSLLVFAGLSVIRFIAPGSWSPRQILFVTGADQVAVFDAKYYFFAVLILLSWAVPIMALVRNEGLRSLVSSSAGQLAILSAVFVFALPRSLLLPWATTPLSILAPRSSLVSGVSLTAVAARLGYKRARLAWHVLVATAWFAVLAGDWNLFGRFENRLEQALSTLPRGSLVIASMTQPLSRIDHLTHIVDRACIDRCLSYGNYEASTKVFRLRARAGNRFVLTEPEDLYAVESGQYRAPRGVSLWTVVLDRSSGGLFRPVMVQQNERVPDACVDVLWQFPLLSHEDRCRFGRTAKH